jgi:hypothetical protein
VPCTTIDLGLPADTGPGSSSLGGAGSQAAGPLPPLPETSPLLSLHHRRHPPTQAAPPARPSRWSCSPCPPRRAGPPRRRARPASRRSLWSICSFSAAAPIGGCRTRPSRRQPAARPAAPTATTTAAGWRRSSAPWGARPRRGPCPSPLTSSTRRVRGRADASASVLAATLLPPLTRPLPLWLLLLLALMAAASSGPSRSQPRVHARARAHQSVSEPRTHPTICPAAHHRPTGAHIASAATSLAVRQLRFDLFAAAFDPADAPASASHAAARARVLAPAAVGAAQVAAGLPGCSFQGFLPEFAPGEALADGVHVLAFDCDVKLPAPQPLEVTFAASAFGGPIGLAGALAWGLRWGARAGAAWRLGSGGRLYHTPLSCAPSSSFSMSPLHPDQPQDARPRRRPPSSSAP